MYWKKLYQIYREEGLTVHKRGDRKRAVGTKAPMTVPLVANQRWSLDFVSDSLSCGRRFRILNVTDDFNHECLAAVVDTSLSGDRVAHELNQISEISLHGSQRQWVRTDFECDPEMVRIPQSRLALYRAQKTCAEWLCRELQWPHERLMSERAPVRQLASCPPVDRCVACRLQPPPPTHKLRWPDASRIC